MKRNLLIVFLLSYSSLFSLENKIESLSKSDTSSYAWKKVSPIDTSGKPIYDLFFFNKDEGWVTGVTVWGGGFGGLGLGHTTDGGATWDTTVIPWIYGNFITFATQEIGILGNGYNLITNDSGKTWNKVFVDPAGFNRAAFANEYIGWVVGGYGTIVKITDAGKKWFYQRSDVIDTNGGFIGLSVIDSLNIYLCSQIQLIYSSDGGDTWKNIPIPEQYVSRFGDAKFIDKNYGWLCGQFRTVIRTTDGGATWEDKSPPVYWDAIRSIDALDKNYALIATSAGAIVRTYDGGETWVEELPANTYTNLLHRVQIIDGQVAYAVGNDGAILKKNKGSYTTVEEADIEITGYSLLQNYPNPFNPTTTISYTLPTDGIVTVKVFDMLGREVRTLVNGYNGIGYKEITWDGKDKSGNEVSSGIYFYNIRFQNNSITKKMLLVR